MNNLIDSKICYALVAIDLYLALWVNGYNLGQTLLLIVALALFFTAKNKSSKTLPLLIKILIFILYLSTLTSIIHNITLIMKVGLK